MIYRREVDGLRALAVVPVILFHAGFAKFSGGFIGVDIFFVISGYLITTIIISDLENGKFSIVDFYERRARRILPALFVVMLVCVPFAWYWLLPSEMQDFSESLGMVSLFVSNFLFWLESGYFEKAAELKPLLHTWSLAVEEQFYVLFPLFLMSVWYLGKRWVMVMLTVAAAASLTLAQWSLGKDPMANFFLLPTRGWELAMGAFVAFYFSRSPDALFSYRSNQILSLLGISLIICSIIFFNKSTPFPSVYALIPTAGTALILMCAWPETLVGRILASRLFVGLGLISYSAYLWHQPIFSFARHRSFTEPTPLFLFALTLMTLTVAYLSWRFVEQPFRNNNVIGRTRVFYFAFLGSISFIFVGIYGHLSNGYFFRDYLKERLVELENRVRANYGLSTLCEKEFNDSPECQTDPDPEVILWGDSFAMHLAPMLLSANPEIKLVQKTVSVCGPVLDIAPITPEYTVDWAKKCIETNDKVMDYIRNSKSIKYAVLGSIFIQYVDTDAQIMLRDGQIINGENVSREYIDKTLHELEGLGITPIIISPTPHDWRDIGGCLTRSSMLDMDIRQCDFPLPAFKGLTNNILKFLDYIELKYRVIWLSDMICPNKFCLASIDDTFVYRDSHHLSYEGSAHIGSKYSHTLFLPTQQKAKETQEH
jgi:peptidoglycan/LPS O-acetylase OafA/YrhL